MATPAESAPPAFFDSMPRIPLFSRRPVRTVAGATAAALTAHIIMWLLPHSLQAFNLIQTSVAILAIAIVMVLIGVHHNREGRLMTQTQEEMVLICAFGLFWLAMLVAMRSSGQRSAHPGHAEVTSVRASAGGGGAQSYVRPSTRGRRPGFTTVQRPYPCRPDDVYCVVEEWSFF